MGKNEIMEVEVMKVKDKCFMCLTQFMICDKKFEVRKWFHTVPDMICKKAAI